MVITTDFNIVAHKYHNKIKMKVESEQLQKENKKLKEENEKLKDFALKVHNFAFRTKWDDDSIVSAMDFDSIIEEMENDENTLKEEIINLKKKVYYYDGFLTKMFDEDERGEWSEWTDFVDKISDTDGKELFGFDSDDSDSDDSECYGTCEMCNMKFYESEDSFTCNNASTDYCDDCFDNHICGEGCGVKGGGKGCKDGDDE
tara:strand:+ start:286 stop:891 length:606 start_codon:yes stop_codon:yes gene_type:complete